MPLGIRPTVDFAFKMLFGNPANVDLLIHLLNSVLRPAIPIVHVEILNPINEKNFADDKLSVVDVKARDASGAWFVLEVQTSVKAGLKNRLVYYTSGLFYGQLREGEGYTSLRPAISICFLTQPLFPEVAAGHLDFRMMDRQHKVSLGEQLQIHLVELSKYNITESQLGSAEALECWTYFMNRADQYEAEELRQLLPDEIFQKATGVLEMITRSPELRLIYDDRAKEELDKLSEIQDAVAEAEARGKAEGDLLGRIRLLRELLDVADPTEELLAKMDLVALQDQVKQLQNRLAQRS